MTRNQHSAVTAVLEDYLEGLFHGDTRRLRRVFHPRAIYASPSEHPLLYRTMEEYFPVVEARPVPSVTGDTRDDEQLLSIEFGSDDMAFARVTCGFLGKRFTDFLTLVREDGRWQIISKVFHAETANN